MKPRGHRRQSKHRLFSLGCAMGKFMETSCQSERASGRLSMGLIAC